MNKVRTAVIGVGYLGRFHAQKYAQLAESELVAVVDADAATRERVAAETGCRPVAEFTQILGEVDALSIATPTPLQFGVGHSQCPSEPCSPSGRPTIRCSQISSLINVRWQ